MNTVVTPRNLEQEMTEHLGPGGPNDDPWGECFDPQGDATALCRNCWFPVAKRTIPTGNHFRGPFWYKAWVHAGTGERDCSGPMAQPDIDPGRNDPPQEPHP